MVFGGCSVRYACRHSFAPHRKWSVGSMQKQSIQNLMCISASPIWRNNVQEHGEVVDCLSRHYHSNTFSFLIWFARNLDTQKWHMRTIVEYLWSSWCFHSISVLRSLSELTWRSLISLQFSFPTLLVILFWGPWFLWWTMEPFEEVMHNICKKEHKDFEIIAIQSLFLNGCNPVFVQKTPDSYNKYGKESWD